MVDIDAIEHSKISIRIDQFIHSDLLCFFDKISRYSPKITDASWVERCAHWKHIFMAVETQFICSDAIDLYQLADRLSIKLPNPSTIITDSGLAEVILPTNLRFADGMNCIHPASQGAMGFALPAAIGAQHATKHLVIAIIADGSIMMNLQELESIRYQQLPIKIIVIHNNMYAIIRRRQRELFRNRTIGTDPSNGVSCPDFSKLAECFGMNYLKINQIDDLDSGLTSLFSITGPVLCELVGRTDQEYIEVGLAKRSGDRCLTRRPLEDQKPFLLRDVFMREMLIQPIDQ